MNYDAALAAVRSGEIAPIYVLSGGERVLADEFVAAVRDVCLKGAVAAFNEDRFVAGDASIDAVLGAAQTVPMMASRRFVLVRQVERWETASDSGEGPLDALATYASAPNPTTCVVLVSSKLDGRRKFATLAKKRGFLIDCETPPEAELAKWVARRCRECGNSIDADVATAIVDIAGIDLGTLLDVVERLTLYVGEGAAITDEAVSECVVRVRTQDAWALVAALAERDALGVFRSFEDAFDARDRGLPLVGALAWSVRQLFKFRLALEEGQSEGDAARAAGAFQPHRARELARRARSFAPGTLERWIELLGEADRSLKGSRLPPELTLSRALMEMQNA